MTDLQILVRQTSNPSMLKMQQRLHDAVVALGKQALERKADCEALQLALEVERDAANLYAKRVAHWIEKHDALLAQQLASEDRAQRDAEHLAELRAYELTVANLREQLALPETVEVLLCDFCGCETPDPWHGSTETDHHIHACDACKPKLWASQAPQAQRGEPVAWKWRFPDGDLSESPFESRSECERDAVGYDGEAIPLYTHPQAPQVPMTLDSVVDLVGECGLDWHKGFEPLFDGDPTNRFSVLVEAVEDHHNIKERP